MNMVVFTLEQRFAKWAYDRLTEDADFGKKNHVFRWSSFWSWRICKEAKFLHLGHRKRARIHWKADAPKTSHCLVRILFRGIIGHFSLKISKEMPLQSMAIVIDPCWTNFCSEKLKRRLLAIFAFNGAAFHSMFCSLFLKITLSAAELMSFDHLGDAIWHRWTIICWGAVKDKCYADKPETIDALKDNIREAVGEIQLHAIDNVLKKPIV